MAYKLSVPRTIGDVTAPTSRSKPGPKGTLSTDLIARTGLDLLDAEGAGALSVRRVATELGVQPNALYTYVADRTGLERAVAELALAEADIGLLDGPARRWRSRIESYARSLRSVLLAHSGVAGLLMRAPMDGPAALAVGEGLLAAFADAGLRPRDAARAVWPVIVFVIGSLALDAADVPTGSPLGPEAERVADRSARFADVDAATWPLTSAAADTIARWPTAAQFDWGLRRLLDGLGGAAMRKDVHHVQS